MSYCDNNTNKKTTCLDNGENMYKHLNISITLCGEETCTDELQISLDDVIRSADVAGRIGTLIGEGYGEGTFGFHIEGNAMSVAWNCTTSESR